MTLLLHLSVDILFSSILVYLGHRYFSSPQITSLRNKLEEHEKKCVCGAAAATKKVLSVVTWD